MYHVIEWKGVQLVGKINADQMFYSGPGKHNK